MTQRFSIENKSELFAGAYSMHDCSFTAAYENNNLTLFFDNLDRYVNPALETPIFGEFKKLAVKYYGVEYLNLGMKFGRKEKAFYDTVSPLNSKELIMFKYSVDSLNALCLHFRVFIKKKMWGGTIEISPTEIEYIWE